MGCGVSKEDISKPSKIQTVVVNVGSPESHLRAHEATVFKQSHSLVCLVGTQCNGGSCGVNNSDLDISLLQTPPLVLNDGLQILFESPQSEEDVQEEEDHEDLPSQNTIKTAPLDEAPQELQVVQESPLFPTTNGLVGTLAGLDEILGIQEASSLKLAIKVTAEKIMSYGGVLHSLEDQLGGISYPLECNTDTPIELDHRAKEGPRVLQITIENCNKIEKPTPTTSPEPSLEGFRKRLPPILTPPNSSVLDSLSLTDPFAKPIFPIQCQPKLEGVQDVTDRHQPPSPQLPHTSEMVALENVKDITVMVGTSSGCDESHCDVGNIILSKTMMETQENTNGNDDSHNVNSNPNFHTIMVSSLIQGVDEKSGVNTISPLTPFSTCSRRIEYLEADDITPLTSEEFYS